MYLSTYPSIYLSRHPGIHARLESQLFFFWVVIAGAGQMRALQLQKASIETEQRHLTDQADADRARTNQLEKQLSVKRDTIATLQDNAASYQVAPLPSPFFFRLGQQK